MLIIDFPKLVTFITNVYNVVSVVSSTLKALVDAMNSAGIKIRID